MLDGGGVDGGGEGPGAVGEDDVPAKNGGERDATGEDGEGSEGDDGGPCSGGGRGGEGLIGVTGGDGPGGEAGLKRLVKQLKQGRLRVKLFLKHAFHAKLYLAHRDDSIIAYLGSSNLTMAGLKGQGELNIDVLDKDAAKKLFQWFKDRWDDSHCLDITEELITIIEESWAGDRLLPPYHVYLKMAWHLFQDAREGIKEFRVPHEIRHFLLPSQEKAVQLACRHLNKRGGVLVGDVVGLGKTRVASAIARVMADDQMLETLIKYSQNRKRKFKNRKSFPVFIPPRTLKSF